MKSIAFIYRLFFFCNMVYDVIMVKFFISLGANNSPKTTILIYRWWHLCQVNSFVPKFFPSDKKQHYSEGIFCILAANANVHYLKDYVHDLY